MKSIGDILKEEIENIMEVRPTAIPIFKWKEIVGNLASQSRPDEIEDGVIKITANSSSALYLLSLKKSEIQRKIEEITKIKIRKVIIK